MNPRDILNNHLQQKHVLQLATYADEAAWCCNLHFYSDDKSNLYWVSSINAGHSHDIAQNQNVAAAILVHENTDKEDYVIGVSVRGTAEALETVDEAITSGYVAKHGRDTGFVDALRADKSTLRFYKLTPSKIILIDSKNFPEKSRQEII